LGELLHSALQRTAEVAVPRFGVAGSPGSAVNRREEEAFHQQVEFDGIFGA